MRPALQPKFLARFWPKFILFDQKVLHSRPALLRPFERILMCLGALKALKWAQQGWSTALYAA